MSCTHSRVNSSPASRDGSEGCRGYQTCVFRRSGQSSSDVSSQGSQGTRAFSPVDSVEVWEGELASNQTNAVHLTACRSLSASHTGGMTVLQPASHSWDGAEARQRPMVEKKRSWPLGNMPHILRCLRMTATFCCAIWLVVVIQRLMACVYNSPGILRILSFFGHGSGMLVWGFWILAL